MRAQLLLQQGRWAEAEGAASCGVALLAEWGHLQNLTPAPTPTLALVALALTLTRWATAYDKRMPWNAWLNWGRCLALQAKLREWPGTHGGLESLGATHPRMRFRGLNTSRHASSATSTTSTSVGVEV